jgi:glycosyltransferase involved in cell wall biosynthesis
LLASKLEELGWRVRRAGPQPSWVLRGFSQIVMVLKGGRRLKAVIIDVFSTRSFVGAELVAGLARICGLPVVLVLRGGNLVKRAKRNRRRVAWLLKGATAVVTPSKYLRKALHSHTGVEATYLPNGLPVQKYRFRQRRHVRPHLVWLRALHEGYNPLMALKALALVRLRFPEATLVFGGPDKGDGTRALVEREADRLGLTEHVEFRGNVAKSEVPAFLSSCDIFLNTTRAESFGVSVMEAGACGLCVVSTDAGELPHLWRDEHDALLVPVDDSGAMAQAVLRILDDPDLAARLSRNARANAERFEWPAVLPQWKELLEQIARGNRAVNLFC